MKISQYIQHITFLGAVLISGSALADDKIYIQVRSSKLRAQPNAWSSQIASLSYGDALTKIGGEEPWYKVKTTRGQTGYIPTSSVTERKVVFNSGSIKNNGVNQSDVVLAGKGFSKEVEQSFAASSHANFSAVNAIEKLKVSDGEMKEFAKAGQLRSGK